MAVANGRKHLQAVLFIFMAMKTDSRLAAEWNRSESKDLKHKNDADNSDFANEDSDSDESVEDKELYIEEKELVIEKDSDSDEEDKEITPPKETVELEKGSRVRKRIYDTLLEPSGTVTESVYINPLTYFDCSDLKSNLLLNVIFVDKYGSNIKSDYVLKGKEVIALYFSCSYCKRGQLLLPTLKTIHGKAEEHDKSFEIVYVSFDDTKEEMMNDLRLNHGNWFAVDYDDPMRLTLKHVYRILALPQLVVIDCYGETITRTGVVEVESNGINVLVTWF